MSDIYAIGDKNSILPFEAIGAKTIEATTDAEALSALKQIQDNKNILVFITENLKPGIQEVLDDNPELIYLYIPPIRGTTGDGAKQMNEIIQKAMGVKVV